MNTWLHQQFGLDGKRAVVTGASRGIGRAIAVALAAAGAEVLVHYHKGALQAEETVKEIVTAGGRAWSGGADLTHSDSTNALFDQVKERWGALDILVNNAGDMVTRTPLDSIDDVLMNSILEVNLGSCLRASRAAIPLLRRGVKPAIVNMTSMNAHHGGFGGTSVYAASKGAILTLTRSLARELAPQIRVNAISPGLILTGLHDRLTPADKVEQVAASTPLGRNGTTEECGAAVVFLCGPGASFITGEVIEINGGLYMT